LGTTEQPPIVCCLSANEHQSRIAWIINLALRALRSHVRDDLVLLLFYAPEAAPEVQRMVEQERICCPFLTFEMDQSLKAASVRIIAPEAARDSADMLFGPFLGGASRKGQ